MRSAWAGGRGIQKCVALGGQGRPGIRPAPRYPAREMRARSCMAPSCAHFQPGVLKPSSRSTDALPDPYGTIQARQWPMNAFEPIGFPAVVRRFGLARPSVRPASALPAPSGAAYRQGFRRAVLPASLEEGPYVHRRRQADQQPQARSQGRRPERAVQAFARVVHARDSRAVPSSRSPFRPTSPRSSPDRKARRPVSLSRRASPMRGRPRSSVGSLILSPCGSPATATRSTAGTRRRIRRRASLFDAVEQARVEAIGALRMEGVASNLTAMLDDRYHRSPFAEARSRDEAPLEDAVAMLARERLTGLKPPAGAERLTELWRSFVEEKAGRDLDKLNGAHSRSARLRQARAEIVDLARDGERLRGRRRR